MKTLTARQIIKKEYNRATNFMTPKVIKYGKVSKEFAYELSKGEGFNHNEIYGVTVVHYDPLTGNTYNCPEKSKCCHSLGEVLSYINELKYMNEFNKKGG